MSIIDIGLMSGFVPVIETLDNLDIANVVDGTSKCQLIRSYYIVHVQWNNSVLLAAYQQYQGMILKF